MKVAVLSKDFEPLTYCNVERAIVLLYLNKAEAITNTNHVIRSVSSVYKVPRIIRLLYKTAKRYIPVIRYSRKNIHSRDNHSCQYCGSSQNLTIDHVMPVSRGGKSNWENTVTACLKCNNKKGNKTPAEAGMPLRKEPVKPSLTIDIDWSELFTG